MRKRRLSGTSGAFSGSEETLGAGGNGVGLKGWEPGGGTKAKRRSSSWGFIWTLVKVSVRFLMVPSGW
nr:hypothetical protein [Armatimonas sp.]